MERMVPVDAFVRDLVHRLRFFRSLDSLPDNGRLLAWHGSRVSLLAHLRDYLHLACHSAGLPTSIVPHQLRHTYGTEMLRAGAGFAAVMKLLGHTDPGMTMRYVDVTLTDLQREFQLARSQPRHLTPQPKTSHAPLRTGHDDLIDSLLVAQSLMLVFRRSLPIGNARSRLDRLANRLTKILTEIRKLQINRMKMSSDWPVNRPLHVSSLFSTLLAGSAGVLGQRRRKTVIGPQDTQLRFIGSRRLFESPLPLVSSGNDRPRTRSWPRAGPSSAARSGGFG
jgi:hypothetical protein